MTGTTEAPVYEAPLRGLEGPLANFGRSWVQDDGLALRAEDALERLRTWGQLAPARVEGYSPFRDQALLPWLASNTDALRMFTESGSPEESEYIRRRVDMLRSREEALQIGQASWSRFLAGVVGIGSLVTAPIGVGAIRSVGSGALRVGALSGAVTGGLLGAGAGTLPDDIRPSFVPEVALSALFGAALGGVAGGVAARSLRSAAARHAFVHDQVDGFQTPGVDEQSRREWLMGSTSLMRELGPSWRTSPMVSRETLEALDGTRAVDDKGVPLTLYHGTNHVFDEFSVDALGGNTGAASARRGFFFAGTPETASAYHNRINDVVAAKGEAERVFSLAAPGPNWRQELDEVVSAAREYVAALKVVQDADLARYDFSAPIALRVKPDADEGAVRAAEARADELFRRQGQLTEQIALKVAADGMVSAKEARQLLDHIQTSARAEVFPDFRDDVAPNVRPVHLRLRNPLIHDFGGENYRDVTYSQLLEEARATGHDGAIFRNTFDGGPEDDIYVVFSPDQIRPAMDFHAEAKRTAAELHDRLTATFSNDAPPEPPAPPPGAAPSAPTPDAPPVDDQRLAATGIGIERWRGAGQLPYLLLKNNRFTGAIGNAIARWADEIVQIPGMRLAGNALGIATDTASIEARAKQHGARFAAAMKVQDQLYYRHAGWDPESATDVNVRLKQGQEMLQGQQPGRLTFAQFDERVSRAIAGGGKDQIPEVNEAAASWRQNFYEPYEREAAEAGVLLSARYRKEGEAAIGREIDARKARMAEIRELERTITGTDPAVRDKAEAEVAKAEAAVTKARGFADESRAAMAAEPNSSARRQQMAEAIDAQRKADEARTAAGQALAALDNGKGSDPVLLRLRTAKAEEKQAQASAEARLKQLGEMSLRKEAYVPHPWKRAVVAERRDELVDRITLVWEAERPMGSWAPAAVRAEIAVSHLLGEGIPDTLRKALARWHRLNGLSPELAAARATEEAEDVARMVAATAPSRLGVEIRSAWGTRAEQPKAPGLAEAISVATKAAGIVSTKQDELVKQILGKQDGSAPDDWADSFLPGHAKERTIDVPTALIADFLDLNQRQTAADYARRMGASIETARKMGDPSMVGRLAAMELAMLKEVQAGRGGLEEIDAVLGSARDLRDKVLGTFAVPEDPSAYSVRTLRFLTNAAVLQQMGSALLANVIDVGRVVMAHGFREVFWGAAEALTQNRQAWRLAGDEAAEAGAALELTLLSRTRELSELRDVHADVTTIERWAEQGARGMQFLNLVAPWTQQLQRFSGSLHASRMIQLSLAAADDGLSVRNAEQLAAYGISPDMARRVADAWRAAGDAVDGRAGPLYLANTKAWADADLVRDFRAALATAVDASVMKPGAADRPNFMSKPLFQAMFLYKSFAMAATQRFVMAGLQQRDGLVLSGMLSSIALAWIIEGPDKGAFDKNPIWSDERLFRAIDRSGVMGIVGDLNNAVEMATANAVGLRPLLNLTPIFDIQAPLFQKDPSWAQRVGAILGPTINPSLNVIWAFTDPAAEPDKAAAAIRRMLPFNNLLYIRGLVDSVAKQGGEFFMPGPQADVPAVALP
jgi:hypothetical protein